MPGLTMTLTFDTTAFTSVEINDWGKTSPRPTSADRRQPRPPWWGTAATAGHRATATAGRGDEITTAISRSHLSSISSSRTWAGRTHLLRGADVLLGACVRSRGAGCWRRSNGRSPRTSLALYPDPLEDDTYDGTMFGTAVVANEMPEFVLPIS